MLFSCSLAALFKQIKESYAIEMSPSSEKFCLKWDYFQKTITSTFQEMRDDLDLADVTLACEDRNKFQAHKFVLSASSPFFMDILRKNKHPHPLIYLNGIKAVVLESVLDFLYRGEVNIYQEDLNDFLVAAEQFEIKGLTGQQQTECLEEPDLAIPILETKLQPKQKKELYDSYKCSKQESNDFPIYKPRSFSNVSSKLVPVEERSIVSSQVNIVNNDDLKETIESMIEKVEDIWACKICGHRSNHGPNIKRHIESKHTTGVSHPCYVCGKILKSTHSFNTHMSKLHTFNPII